MELNGKYDDKVIELQGTILDNESMYKNNLEVKEQEKKQLGEKHEKHTQK